MATLNTKPEFGGSWQVRDALSREILFYLHTEAMAWKTNQLDKYTVTHVVTGEAPRKPRGGSALL